jgi:iron complex transport system substrate-binding protein
MKLNEHVMFWNKANIRIMDVRLCLISSGQELRAYRFPTSVFLYVVKGNAQVSIDGSLHSVNRFHVLHGGKGACLDIIAQPLCEYYMILYQGQSALPARQEVVKLMEQHTPYALSTAIWFCSFIPHNTCRYCETNI